MSTTSPAKGLLTLVAYSFLSLTVIAKGPPPDLMITLESTDTTIVLGNYATMGEGMPFENLLGTVALQPGDHLTLHWMWTYPMQDVTIVTQDSTWLYSYMGPWGNMTCDLGPVGAAHIYANGLEWSYSVALVVAAFDEDPHPLRVTPYVWLSGAFREDDPDRMGTELCMNGLLPLQEPYSAMGWMPEGSGGEITTAEVLAPQTSSWSNVVDWVLVELRDENDPSIVVDSKCALLHAGGWVSAADGFSPVTFLAPYGNYYLAVRHRNHLGAMTSAPFNDMSIATTLYFYWPTVVHGSDPLCMLASGRYGLWPGNIADAGPQSTIKYVGASNDRDPILTCIGGSTPNNTLSGYRIEDINLDGVVKYIGAASDRDIVLQSIGGSAPAAFRVGQLP